MKKAHFIGICGVGMSATAKLLKDLGWHITGSDDNFYPPGSELVKRYDIPFFQGYKAENIPGEVDLIVIGKNAKLTPEENKEVSAAMESGVTIRSFPEVLEQLVTDKHSVVIAGSYGKSTCTGLLAWCLLHSGKDPSYFLGAIPINTGMETACIGSGDIFVLEGDEYPAANWDKTSKFLFYHPKDVLLTSAAHDHVNVFPTHDEYLVPFKTLLSLMPPEGLVVASADDESARALARTHPGNVTLYGLTHPESQWSARNIVFGKTTTFELVRGGKSVVALSTPLLGAHNIQNIVGVSALLIEKDLLTPDELTEGIQSFTGIKRRLELLSPTSRVPIYEGFGSSYEKARAAIEALRLHFPERRLIVIFEPHTFSWRNRNALSWYDNVFAGSDMVLVYEPATQGADTHKQLTQEEIVARIQQGRLTTHAIHTEADGLSILKQELDENDVVLLLTSGNLGGLRTSIPQLVEMQFPMR
jgi:UDP-N-acetylmuramate: L-alanyl-gamma-D-glutamyl-meso-diaminopimelate ligase